MQEENSWLKKDNEKSENVILVTPKGVAKEIKPIHILKRASGFNLISREIIKRLPRKGIVRLTYLFIAAYTLKHVPEW